MNKKGMTLIELIAVIAILSILSIITVPSITGIRNRTLKTSLDSKIETIKSAALEYSNDNINNVPKMPSCFQKKETTKKSYEALYSINDKPCYDDCLIIKVGSLIGKGYLTGDDDSKELLMNPLTNKSLNNELVCIRFDSQNAISRKLEAYILKEDDLYEDE